MPCPDVISLRPCLPSSPSVICGVERTVCGNHWSYLGRSRVSQLHRELMLCAVITLNLGAGLCFLALTVATVNTAGEQLTDCVFCSEQLQKAHRHNSQSTESMVIFVYIFSVELLKKYIEWIEWPAPVLWRTCFQWWNKSWNKPWYFMWMLNLQIYIYIYIK